MTWWRTCNRAPPPPRMTCAALQQRQAADGSLALWVRKLCLQKLWLWTRGAGVGGAGRRPAKVAA